MQIPEKKCVDEKEDVAEGCSPAEEIDRRRQAAAETAEDRRRQAAAEPIRKKRRRGSESQLFSPTQDLVCFRLGNGAGTPELFTRTRTRTRGAPDGEQQALVLRRRWTTGAAGRREDAGGEGAEADGEMSGGFGKHRNY
uniref:Uncharacterized protein n=1 Tax=Leersia perrieri TaxID=77586 RepID=A0A0D9W1Y5_9ORYZ